MTDLRGMVSLWQTIEAAAVEVGVARIVGERISHDRRYDLSYFVRGELKRRGYRGVLGEDERDQLVDSQAHIKPDDPLIEDLRRDIREAVEAFKNELDSLN